MLSLLRFTNKWTLRRLSQKSCVWQTPTFDPLLRLTHSCVWPTPTFETPVFDHSNVWRLRHLRLLCLSWDRCKYFIQLFFSTICLIILIFIFVIFTCYWCYRPSISFSSIIKIKFLLYLKKWQNRPATRKLW